LALKALEDSLSAIKARGVTLVAISPELPNQSLTTQEKNELQFPVLSDVGNNLARKLGILFQQPETVRPILKAYGVDLQARNGDDSYEVPFPASYLIDSKGMIRYAFLDPDYTRRLEPSTALGWIDGCSSRKSLCSSRASAMICHEAESTIQRPQYGQIPM
jgi:peroxiredoxin